MMKFEPTWEQIQNNSKTIQEVIEDNKKYLDAVREHNNAIFQNGKVPQYPAGNVSLFKKIDEFIEMSKSFFKGVETFNNYITHPALIGKAIWSFTVANSYWVCLVIFAGGILFWIYGGKKGAIVSKISLGVFIVIQAINSVF